jgi:hypothetical protein
LSTLQSSAHLNAENQADIGAGNAPFERFAELEREWELDSASLIGNLREGLYGEVKREGPQ